MMANVPENLHYSKDHEWISVEGDIGTIGITDHAQDSLGDVVYVELPKVGETFNADDVIGIVESVKATSEIYTPVSGEVVEVNELLLDEDNTPLVNTDPYGKAWMIRLRLEKPGEVDSMLTAAEYEDFTKPEPE
jgi:glycine cleavage system H protein